jgi:hypothetical protein
VRCDGSIDDAQSTYGAVLAAASPYAVFAVD